MSNPASGFSFTDPSVPAGATAPASVSLDEITSQDISRLSRSALQTLEDIMTGKEPGATPGQKLQAAQWLLEKHSGKPKQEGEESNTLGIAAVIDALARLNASARPEGQALLPGSSGNTDSAIDVTPEPAPERDPIDVWVEENVPFVTNEVKR